MKFILRLSTVALLWASSISAWEASDPANDIDYAETAEYKLEAQRQALLDKYRDQLHDPDFDHRLLDAMFEADPTPKPTSAPKPTKKPTKKPTRHPTSKPTKHPTPSNYNAGPPDICGTIRTTCGEDLVLGPYEKKSWGRDKDYFDCGNDKGTWWERRLYHPDNHWWFRVTKRCVYEFQSTWTDQKWKETRDINTFIEQMAISLRRPNNAAYKVTGDEVVFKGDHDYPNKNSVVKTMDSPDCPEKWCVKIFGPFLAVHTDAPTPTPTGAPTYQDKTIEYVGNQNFASNPLDRCQGDCDNDSHCQGDFVCYQRNANQAVPEGCSYEGNMDQYRSWTDFCGPPKDPWTGLELVYAFSHEGSANDFYHTLRSIFNDGDKQRIFGTNYFLRCGCEPFCMEDTKKWDNFEVGATCYEEYKCDNRVFMIKYKDNYVGTKASWHAEGTTNILDWFSECAKAMYSCSEIPSSWNKEDFKGIGSTNTNGNYKSFPRVWKYDNLDISEFLLPMLNFTGDNGKPAEAFPLGNCEGDCDSDNDCAGNLVCMQRNNYEPVPGCGLGGHKYYDYCYDLNYGNANPLPIAKKVGNHNFAGTLGMCEGDCDNDSHCQPGLVCYQRTRPDKIPGCIASSYSNSDDFCTTQAAIDTFVATGNWGWVEDTSNQASADWVYALGGDKYQGFNLNLYQFPSIHWTCPSQQHREELSVFGEYVAGAELFRYYDPTDTVPSPGPCPDETFDEPVDPPEPQPLLACQDIPDTAFCYHDTDFVCYAKKLETNCEDVQFAMVNRTGAQYFDEVAPWFEVCLENLDCHRVPAWHHMDGNLTGTGYVTAHPHWSNHIDWELLLFSKDHKNNGGHSIEGKHRIMWFDCADWLQTYKGKNFTNGVGDRHSELVNTYGDLFRERPCTEQPSSTPSQEPTATWLPSSTPSISPTFCAESYLTSEDLNIALIIDLSYSTYTTDFSAENPVGDVNGDGKGNTILDAQVVAIEELLGSIADSDQLNNANCEIELIGFSTDAKSHGVWKPLEDSNDQPNQQLMAYVKQHLRAPTSVAEVKATNNGYTNFDAALDKAVEYFQNTATANRKDLMVFLSDGIPNVRGDGDNEGYCSDEVEFWANSQTYKCADNPQSVAAGVKHNFCRGDDPNCVNQNPYQDCVRGPAKCTNHAAVTQYTSEIDELTRLGVERLAIGVGAASDVSKHSALWVIDNNPAKYLGVLPLQALNLDELSEYLGSLCILNTDPPTKSPSDAPSLVPSVSAAPSSTPSVEPSGNPSESPSARPTEVPTRFPTRNPTPKPTGVPSVPPTGVPSVKPTPSPTGTPTAKPTPATAKPTSDPTKSPVDLERQGGADDDDTITVPEVGPDECPPDILLLSATTGTALPRDTVRIVRQDTTSVTVQIHQMFTDAQSNLDSLYYQYKYNDFSTKCYEQENMPFENAVEFTIQCMVSSKIGLLEFWAVDNLSKGFLQSADDEKVPDCCYPDEPSGTPVAKYVLAVKCSTECPDKTFDPHVFNCASEGRCMQVHVNSEESNPAFLRGVDGK